jgi:hypothetical protein
MLLQKLNSPYPFTARFPEALKTIIFISSFIVLFVFLFRSHQFGIEHSGWNRLLISSHYGIITFVVAAINTFIFHSIITTKRESEWKVWYEILLYLIQFFTISIAIFFLSIYTTHKTLTILDFFRSVIQTTLIGAIPVSLHVLYQQNKLYKENFNIALVIDNSIHLNEDKTRKEVIELDGSAYPISDILFAESNKNYLDFYLTENRQINVRLTIKELENKLQKYPQFIRCHRAYLVNSEKIQKVEGNAQGLKLQVSGWFFTVPVSRSYIPKIDHVIRPTK